MRFLRQVALAVSIAGLVASVLRTRAKPTVGLDQGGWREVSPGR